MIDSSAAIKYLNNSLPFTSLLFLDNELDKETNLSIVTKVELLCWSPADQNDLEVFQRFVEEAIVFPISDDVAEIAIAIRKATRVKLPDVFIAATAIYLNAVLVADNDKDFGKIVALNIGLRYLNPFTI